MFPHWTTNSWHCDYHKPRSPTQPRRSLAGLLALPPTPRPTQPTHLLVLSKTCLYKHIESGLTGKASRRFFEHNCHCFKHRKARVRVRVCACVCVCGVGWDAREGRGAFDIQRENIAAWNGINHLQSLIVFQKEKKHTPRPRIAAFFFLFLLYLKR